MPHAAVYRNEDRYGHRNRNLPNALDGLITMIDHDNLE